MLTACLVLWQPRLLPANRYVHDTMYPTNYWLIHVGKSIVCDLPDT